MRWSLASRRRCGNIFRLHLLPLPLGEGWGEGGLRETSQSTGKSSSDCPLPRGEGAEHSPRPPSLRLCASRRCLQSLFDIPLTGAPMFSGAFTAMITPFREGRLDEG